jgi:hypothetical protein
MEYESSPSHDRRVAPGHACRTERPGGLFVQDDGEQRVVDLEPLLVVDESQALEFLHDEIDAPARRADGTMEYVYKIKLWNKPLAMELFGRNQGLFRENRPDDRPQVPATTLPADTPDMSVH